MRPGLIIAAIMLILGILGFYHTAYSGKKKIIKTDFYGKKYEIEIINNDTLKVLDATMSF